MSERALTIEHNGVTYRGELARITSTTLGPEGHGIFSAFLVCEWDGSGVSVGGYGMDTPADKSENANVRETRDKYDRAGTAFGMDLILQILQTVGASSWEKLAGSSVIVLFDGGGAAWGKTARGIAGVHNDRVLVLSELGELWRGEPDAS